MSTSRKTTFFTMVYKGALSALGFVSSALLAWTLSKPNRVDFQFSGTVAQTGMTYVGGYTNYYAYALPKFPEDTTGVVQTGNLVVFVVSLFVWLIAAGAFLLSGSLLHLSSAWQWALACMPLTIIFGYGSRLLQASNHITWLNRANMAQPLLFAGLVLVLYLTRGSFTESTRLYATYACWVLSFLIAAVGTMILAVRLLRQRGLSQLRLHRKHWLGTLHYGGWSSIAQVVNIVNYRIDFWLVYSLLPNKDVASVYGVAVVASEVLLNISGSIASVVFTRMTGNDRTDAIHVTELSSRHTIISSGIVAIGMYLVFPWLIVFAYGHQYSGAIIPFFILLPGLVIKAASNIIIQYATNSLGQPKTSIWMNGVSAAINAVCCIVFIPTLGIVGAALASTISYAGSFIVYAIWFGHVTHTGASGLFLLRRGDFAPYWHMVSAVVRRAGRR